MPEETDLELAERRGWDAYLNGRGPGQCPYWDRPEQDAWLRGYFRAAAASDEAALPPSGDG